MNIIEKNYWMEVDRMINEGLGGGRICSEYDRIKFSEDYWKGSEHDDMDSNK
ncbi:hypothetical protein ACLIBG_01285 [Virgibacillus sp. W0181]|uniref:hypothetical protein n=1 Tax=Virgibacillus sp. W0181 TaxID=3391581 RepID=UPI003F449547